LLLRSYWIANSAGVVFFQTMMAIGWLLIAGNMSVEEAKLFPYMAAFFGFTGALARLVGAPSWYFHMVSVLREAEAD
jgi:hypothetical protein